VGRRRSQSGEFDAVLQFNVVRVQEHVRMELGEFLGQSLVDLLQEASLSQVDFRS
jgi:hypothetical protein